MTRARVFERHGPGLVLLASYWLVVAVAVTPASVVTWTSLGPGGKSVILSTVLS